MRAAVFKGPGSVEVAERPDPAVEEPTDAIVRVVMACVRVGPLVLAGRVSPSGGLHRP